MDEAADHLRRALLLNPNLEPAYYELALAQINQKQPRQALETLERAQTKFPQSFAGEFFSGLAYASMKDYSNAVARLVAAEVIARATDTNRLTHLFYFQLGSAYERNRQFEEAERHLGKAVELSPAFSEALNYLGYMWADRGTNLTAARDMIEKALKVEPENPAYMDSMAWVLYKQGDHAKALEWQLKAVEKEKEPDPTLFDHLGDIYAALKQPEKAAEAWKKSLELQPSEEIKKKLATAQRGESAGQR
jgi:tetratricopeptide (TPR) repeat protein